ncbi:MAG: glycosyltransferase [Bacteroidetes bacterium]|nr:glycosyltransferase [Bacteroidota bacterium]
MDSRKHICHLTSVHHALDTRIFYRFCQSLSAEYRVTLIAVHPGDEFRDGIEIKAFRRFKNKLLRVSITWLIMFVKAMRVNASLYQLHDPELIPCGLLLRLIGKKVILDIHENVAEDIFDKPWIRNKKLLYAFFQFFEWLAVRSFFLFLAEWSYEERYRKLGARYEVVLNYVDPDFFMSYRTPVNRRTNRIFYIGILLESRGLAQIAEALWLLKREGREVHFDVVGELYSALAGQLQALPFYTEIAEQIHFYGRMPLEAGYELSRNAAAGMCIIQPMKNSVGSYPTKMFEYMCIGLPQITSHFPLYASVVEKHACGICVDPAEPQAIAEAAKYLLDNPEQAEKMRQNGIQASGAYIWQSEWEKTRRVYQTLLA